MSKVLDLVRDETGDSLARRLDAMLAGARESELRLVSDAILGRRFRAASGLRAALAVRALQDCASSSGDFVAPATYEHWREMQERPDELPSRRFMLLCFGGSWSVGLDAAGLPLSPGRHAMQLAPKLGRYSREDVIRALRGWLAERDTNDITFAKYRAWAQAQMVAGRQDRLPISAPTFRGVFGSWTRAVAAARGHDADRAQHPRADLKAAYQSERLLEQLRVAAANTRMGAGLTRRAHDQWARGTLDDVAGYRPAHSDTIRRRFGGWARALRAADIR